MALVVHKIPFGFPSVRNLFAPLCAGTTGRRAAAKNSSSSLDTVTWLATRQRSSAHVNPFKAVRERVCTWQRPGRRVRHPVANSISSVSFISIPVFPLLSPLSLSLSRLLALSFSLLTTSLHPCLFVFPFVRSSRFDSTVFAV